MLNVTVKLGETVVNEMEFDTLPVTIGRSPENDLRIENLAVSSRHARVEEDGGGFRVVDLESTNGTYVNERKVSRQAVGENDAVTVGKHTLHFKRLDPAGGNGSAPGKAGTAAAPGDLDHTMILETRSQRERRGREADESRRRQGKVGVLTVTHGAADETTYELTREFTMLGKDPDAGVRLKGFLVPKVAGFVEFGPTGYTLAPPEAGGPLRLNGRAIDARTPLRDGDTLELRGATLRFNLRG